MYVSWVVSYPLANWWHWAAIAKGGEALHVPLDITHSHKMIVYQKKLNVKLTFEVFRCMIQRLLLRTKRTSAADGFEGAPDFKDREL